MHKHSIISRNHYLIMAAIMFVAGLLSTMNIWAASTKDMYLHLNDLYMILLMIGWMTVGMGLYYQDRIPILIGLLIVLLTFIAIRQQWFISERQFLRGMIPHHSMAVHMSQQLLKKNPSAPMKSFAQFIMDSQSNEIGWMKKNLFV